MIRAIVQSDVLTGKEPQLFFRCNACGVAGQVSWLDVRPVWCETCGRNQPIRDRVVLEHVRTVYHFNVNSSKGLDPVSAGWMAGGGKDGQSYV